MSIESVLFVCPTVVALRSRVAVVYTENGPMYDSGRSENGGSWQFVEGLNLSFFGVIDDSRTRKLN